MDKAIIYNVYDFVNFHLCKALLEQGVEVTGLYFQDHSEQFLEEKQLEVGRNANFEERNGQDFDVEKAEKRTVILSLYDLYMDYQVALLERDLYKQTIGQQWEEIILILPVQLSTCSGQQEDLRKLQEYLDSVRKNTQNIYLFYLPTIYGPWQSDTFLFQRTILYKMNKLHESKGIRETTSDCLYIHDTIRTLLSVVKKGKPGAYLLESGLSNYWRQCADFINVEKIPSTLDKRFEWNGDIKRIAIKDLTSIADSITSQIKHVERLYPIEDGLKDHQV